MDQIAFGEASVEVSAEDLRNHLAEYLGQVRFADKIVVVKKHNHETAVIISPRLLRRLVDSRRTSRADRQEAYKKLEQAFESIPAGDPETLDQDIVKAVADSRAAKRKTATK